MTFYVADMADEYGIKLKFNALLAKRYVQLYASTEHKV